MGGPSSIVPAAWSRARESKTRPIKRENKAVPREEGRFAGSWRERVVEAKTIAIRYGGIIVCPDFIVWSPIENGHCGRPHWSTSFGADST
jgi:hypothetical protein